MDNGRRRFWKKIGVGTLGGVLLGGTRRNSVFAQAPGQNFDVIAAKSFANPSTEFTTSSISLVPTNLPTNPTFVKQRSDTYLWVACAIDIVPTTFSACFNAIVMDDDPDSRDFLQVSVAGSPNQLITVNMTDFIPNPVPASAGPHNFRIYVATNSGSCTWRMPSASFRIMEVTVPTLQT